MSGGAILLTLISVFWAMNMGASGFAVSFAPSVGSGIVKRGRGILFYVLFALLGALVFGGRVAKTLSGKIIAPEFISPQVVLIVLSAACLSLFLANILKIPQSTSIITVSSLAGAGLYFGRLNLGMVFYLLFVWLAVSLASYFITYFISGRFYPPRQSNLRFHEKFFRHRRKLKNWTLLTDCYSAFGIGSNNVANVVGPLAGAGVISMAGGFAAFSLIFGLGAFILGKGVLNTTGREIVPLGDISASVVSLVVSTFIIACSVLGLPAPYVQFSSLAILAVHTVKEEKNHSQTAAHPVTKKIIKVWALTPVLSMLTCYLLLLFFNVKR